MEKIDSADKPGRNDPIKLVKEALEKRRKRLELLSVAKLLVELQLELWQLRKAEPSTWISDRLEFSFVVKTKGSVFSHIRFTAYIKDGKYWLSYFSAAGTENIECDGIIGLIRTVRLACGIH